MALAKDDPHPGVRELVWWALATADGRAVLDGSRIGTAAVDEDGEPVEGLVVVFLLGQSVAS